MSKGKKKAYSTRISCPSRLHHAHKNCKIFHLAALVISAQKATKLDAIH
jgi:hypothetical protein